VGLHAQATHWDSRGSRNRAWLFFGTGHGTGGRPPLALPPAVPYCTLNLAIEIALNHSTRQS